MTQERLGSHIRVSLVALLALALLGCGAQTPASAGPSAQGSSGASPGSTGEAIDGGELQFQLIRDANEGYDPGLATLSTVFTIDDLIFDTLAEVQPDGTIVPSLAEEWSISEDELTYTFKIRTGVLFHNGREMTSEDVKYTIERLKDPETLSPRGAIFSSIESIAAPDPTTLIITLSEPFAPLLPALSDITAAIVPREVVEEHGNLHENPVGTGPFKFVEWVRDQHVKVEANSSYWREGIPHLDGITFTFNGDPNARAAAVRSGDVDFLWNAPPELWDVFTSDQNLTVHGGKGTQTFLFLNLNTAVEPLDDVRVRQAIYWALDREEIRLTARPNASSSLNAGFLPPEHWAGVSDIMYTQDYDKARQLLTEAGYPDGFPLEIINLTGSTDQILANQTIQQQLAPLGIKVEVKIVESGEFTTVRNEKTYQGLMQGHTGTIDPDERFQQTFLEGGGTNYASFSDDIVADLAEQARRTSDQAERARLYKEAQRRLAEVGPFAFLYSYHFFDVTTSAVNGYVFNPQILDYRSVRDVWLDQ